MLPVVTIVLPVFGLILLGYLSARFSWLTANAEKGIAEFAFTLAMPALLFKSVATAEFSGLSIIGIWGTYFGTIFVIWLLSTLVTWKVLRRPAPDGPPIAMSTTFGNLVMLGLPLGIATFGNDGAPVIALILAIHAPVLWLTGTFHAGLVDRDGDKSLRDALASLVNELARNPIIIAIALGALWRLTGIELPAPALTMMTLLAQASVPTALVALGMSIMRSAIKGQAPTLTSIIGLKMIAMPLMVYVLGMYVFGLSPLTVSVLTLLAAVPTGANAYLFAVKTGHAVNSASGAVALGTLLSAVTISALLAAIHQ